VQFAVTLTCATIKAEKENKDTSGGATERIRGDISYSKAKGAVGGRVYSSRYLIKTWHSTQIHRFEGLIGAPCDENSGQWLGIIVILRAAVAVHYN
jgi:hypothetical protein